MITEKLFDNGWLLNFEATVVSCVEKDGLFEVELDRSAFAPEGGGQLSDIGNIGDAFVSDVKLRDGTIIYITDKQIKVGTNVACKIDYARRARHIQNHSGEHIVSGIIYKELGYNNVGFHLGSEDVTMDVDGDVDKATLRRIERLANEAVAANLEIKAVYPSPDELDKIFYRSKLDLKDDVRIVLIDGLDACACCAPHVNKTGEIGMIKLVSCLRYKGGTRIYIKCGFDALDEFNAEFDRALAISNMISQPRENIVDGVKKLMDDISGYRREIFELKKRVTDMKIAAASVNDGKCLLVDENMEMSELRAFVAAKLDACDKFCAAFSGNDEDGYTFVIGYKGADFKEFVQKTLEKLGGGSGGGKPPFAQGKAKCKKCDIEALLID